MFFKGLCLVGLSLLSICNIFASDLHENYDLSVYFMTLIIMLSLVTAL